MPGDITPHDLVVGTLYFDVGYLDRTLRAPIIVTVVYIGFDDEFQRYLFEDAASYVGEASGDHEMPAEGFCNAYSEESLDRIYSHTGLGDELLAALRRGAMLAREGGAKD